MLCHHVKALTTEELVLLFCLLRVVIVLTGLLQGYAALCQRTYGWAWPRQHLADKTLTTRPGKDGLPWLCHGYRHRLDLRPCMIYTDMAVFVVEVRTHLSSYSC